MKDTKFHAEKWVQKIISNLYIAETIHHKDFTSFSSVYLHRELYEKSYFSAGLMHFSQQRNPITQPSACVPSTDVRGAIKYAFVTAHSS